MDVRLSAVDKEAENEAALHQMMMLVIRAGGGYYLVHSPTCQGCLLTGDVGPVPHLQVNFQVSDN